MTTVYRRNSPLRVFRSSWPAALVLVLLGACGGQSATERGSGGAGGGLNVGPTAAGGTGAGGGSAAGRGGVAGLAGFPTGCPRTGSIPGPLDPCEGCYGLACEPDQTCQGSFHRGQNASSICVCVEGQMVCCIPRETWCNYGGRTPPQCPARTPHQDEPCGLVPQVCSYPADCEGPEVQMYCTGQTWIETAGWLSVGGSPPAPT